MSWKSKWNYFVSKYIICIIVFTRLNLPNRQLICAELRNQERTLRRKSNNAKRTKSCQRADLHTEVKVNELAVLNKLMACKPSQDFPTYNRSPFGNMFPFGKGSTTTFQTWSLKRDGGRKVLNPPPFLAKWFFVKEGEVTLSYRQNPKSNILILSLCMKSLILDKYRHT